MEKLFITIFNAKTEEELDEIVKKDLRLSDERNWFPLGKIEDNIGLVETQQASAIPALVEKITNSIDAILMRKCLEAGIDPKKQKAPRSIKKAVAKFFPNNKNWDLLSERKLQAENI